MFYLIIGIELCPRIVLLRGPTVGISRAGSKSRSSANKTLPLNQGYSREGGYSIIEIKHTF
jgi:hypothetical protein